MTFLHRLLALLAATALVAATLPNCAGSQDVATTLSQPLDTTIQRQVTHQLTARRIKFNGPITIQVGTGNVNAPKAKAPIAAGASQAQDYSRAGQHGGALAAAPGASAGATTRTGVPPWLLGVGIVVLVLALLAALIYQFRTKLLGCLPSP